MGFAEDKLAEHVRRNMELFHHVKVEELLSYLPCLTKTDQEELRAYLNNKGNQNTVWHLLDCLQRRNNWPTDLINALRRFEYTDLADNLQQKYNSLTGSSHQNNITVAQSASAVPPPAKATSAAIEARLPCYSSSSLSQDIAHAQGLPHASERNIFPHARPQPVTALKKSYLQSYSDENSASAAADAHSSLLNSDPENSSHADSEVQDNFKFPVLETQQSAEVEPPSYSSSSLSQDSHHAQQLPSDENCSHPSSEDTNDLNIPILEPQKSANEVSRTSITSETEKVNGKDPQQNIFSPAAAAPIIELGAEEPKQIGAVVGASVNTQVISRVSEEERSMSISKPGILISHFDEEEPYSGNSDSLQLSQSTVETAENSSVPGDSRNAYLHNEFQLPEANGASPTNIDSNQISDSNDCSIRNDPLIIRNSATDSLPVNSTVPRAGEPEENHYCYDSSPQLLSRRNTSAILDRPDTNDPVREKRGDGTESLASGTVDRHNRKRIASDGISSEKFDDMGRNYSKEITSEDVSLQPEREQTTDPVESSWNSTDTGYHVMHIAEDPDMNLEMANDTVSVPDCFKDSVPASNDTRRKENVPAESSKKKPMLPSTLLFTSILVAVSSVTAVLLWKYLRN